MKSRNLFGVIPVAATLLASSMALPAHARGIGLPDPFQPPSGPGGVTAPQSVTLYTAPLITTTGGTPLGNGELDAFYSCDVLNTTSHGIAMQVELHEASGAKVTPLVGTYEAVVAQPGQVAAGPKAVFSGFSSPVIYCSIKFTGSKDEVRGILTAWGASPFGTTSVATTSEAR